VHVPGAHALLDAWEQGCGETPIERTLTLLLLAHPQTSRAHLAALSIGVRDARLLTLLERSFGPHLEAVTACPSCSERLDVDLSVGDIRADPTDACSEFSVDAGDWEARCRLPTSDDLAAAAESGDVTAARSLLLRRCVLSLRRCGEPVEDLPEKVAAALLARLEELDPQGNVQLSLHCPACGDTWDAVFDVAAYLWMEVDAWARQAARDVHALASAYGWSEAAILSMSPARRRLYLEMVEA
jgi:hypothetical protein